MLGWFSKISINLEYFFNHIKSETDKRILVCTLRLKNMIVLKFNKVVYYLMILFDSNLY